MIHFLVNNDYQYLEAERLALELQAAGRRCCLIAIPHTLTRQLDPSLFDTITTIQTPAHRRWIQAWPRYIALGSRPRALPVFHRTDTLLLFTEFELLNQLTAIACKRQGGKVYLIEDGGVGTYIPLALVRPEAYSLKDRLHQWMIRAIPSLRRTQFTKFDGILFPMLEDKHLDGICLYREMRLNRQVPLHVIARPIPASVEPHDGRVVFLNQPLYSEHIQTPENYVLGLKRILAALQAGFKEVLFKFHPREPDNARSWIIASVLAQFPDIRIVEGRQPFETLLSELRPEAVASYNSTPLLNMSGTGVQPLFVYHLLDDLRHAPSFATMHALLAAWGYHFPEVWEDLASGFQSGGGFDCPHGALPLADVLASASPPA